MPEKSKKTVRTSEHQLAEVQIPALYTKNCCKFHLPCNFVAQRLAGDDGDLLAHPFVGVEVTAQTGVILLDDDPGGLLDCLSPHPPLKRNQSRDTTEIQK